MNDHELDDQIRHLVESYNEPPTTPRDAMWARIEQARAGANVAAIESARRRYWLRTAAGLAAVLVVGIGIGRLTGDVGRPAATGMVASNAAEPGGDAAGQSVAVVSSVSDGGGEPGAAAEKASSGSAATEGMNRVRASRAQRLAELRAERREDARGLAAYGVGRGSPGAVGEGSEMSAYRLAVVEHMARSELLLTSFLAESRANPNTPRTAAQFAVLSRDLLKTTRLLLATRTVDEPALTRLLEDLELVLMQISQYTSEGRSGDLDAINQSLDRRNVLPKLRSTIPAGASASTGI
jgi:hypothetical protein